MRWFLFLIFLIGAALSAVHAQSVDEVNKLRIAEALVQAGEYEKAVDFYKQLYQMAPDNFVYFDGLRRSYMNLKMYEDAETLIWNRIRSDPKNVVLFCELGDAYYKNGQRDSSMIIWNDALTIDSANPNTYRAVANVMVDNRMFDDAIQVYRKAEASTDSKFVFVPEIARLYFLNMNYRQCLRELLRMLAGQQASSNVATIEVQLGMYSSSAEAADQFTDEMEKQLRDNSDSANYRRVLGFLYMEKKNYPAAYETYKWLDAHLKSDGSELFQFASRAYNDEAFDVAADAFREVSDLSSQKPVIAQALLGYANSLRKLWEKEHPQDDRPCGTQDTLKDLSASLATYERILTEFPEPQYVIEAVSNSVQIQMNYFHDYSGAERLLSNYGSAMRVYGPGVTQMRIQLYMSEGNFAEALKTSLEFLQSGQRESSVNGESESLYDRIEYQAALALYYQGMYDSSTYYLRKITSNPMSDAANDAIQLMNTITNNRGNPQALRAFASAAAMEVSNRLPEAAAALEEVLKDYPQAPLAENARFDLAAAYCRLGNVPGALENYAELAADSTGIYADRAQFRICRIHQETLHEKDKAIAEYENFLARFPNSIYQDRVRAILRDLLGEKS